MFENDNSRMELVRSEILTKSSHLQNDYMSITLKNL